MAPNTSTQGIEDSDNILPKGEHRESDIASVNPHNKQHVKMCHPNQRHHPKKPLSRRLHYLALWLAITFLRDIVVPLLLLVCGALVWALGQQEFMWLHDHPLTWLLLVVGMAEALFWIFAAAKTKQFQKPNKTPNIHPEDRLALLERCLDSIENGDYESYIAGWFKNTSFSEIKRGNVEQWMAWGFFDERLRCLTTPERKELEGYMSLIEQRLGYPISPGFNKKVEGMRLMLDPVVIHHRPLMFYVVIAFLRLSHEFFLYLTGFRRDQAGSVTYWYRPSTTSETAQPLVFVHGLGIGLSQYFLLIYSLVQLSKPLFLVEINSVSCRLVEECVPMEQVVPSLEEMISRHGFSQAVWIGHSYGSVYVSWMLRQSPKSVAKAVLLDPVVLLLNLPAVCYNFVYRVPRSIIEAGVHYFASRELHISKSMSRHFHWIQNIVWSEDISCPTLVVLSERDSITNAPAIRRYLEKSANPNIEIEWLSGLNHAGFLFVPRALKRVVARIASLVENS